MISTAVSHTPWWVFALFAYVLYIGIKGLSTRVVTIWKLAIAPAIFAVWGMHSVAQVLGETSSGWMTLAGSLVVGYGIGRYLAQRVRIQPTDNRRAQIEGSPVTLILVLIIFCSKYALGYWAGYDPSAPGEPAFVLSSAGVTGIVVGIFVGRFTGLVRRWKMLASAPSATRG